MPSSNAPSVRRNAWLVLLAFLVATFAVAGISSVFTISQIPTWYATLSKPSFNPPNQLFGPVWTLLYTLMAVAAWRVWRLPASRIRTRGLQLFWIQLVLNFAWSLLFFGAHGIGVAAVDIVLLWAAILATMLLFFKLDRVAACFFALYLAWVSFATALNVDILIRN